MIPGKYCNPPQAPLVFNATAASIHEDSKNVCDRTRSLLDTLATSLTPDDATFANVLHPIALDENERSSVSSVLDLYEKVSADPALREAAAEAGKVRSHFLIDCGMREDVFRLVDAAFKKNEALDTESRKLLTEERRNYLRNGLALDTELERDRLKEIRKRLSTIASEFGRNIDEEGSAMWFTRDELQGVPEDVLNGLECGTGEFEGKLSVTFKDPDYGPLMQFARSSETREKAFKQRENACKENIPLFTEAIHLRHEAAGILGYTNHAAYRLETKMAKTPEAVMAFLEDLRVRASRHRPNAAAELLSLKQSETASHRQLDDELHVWDTSFYTRLLKEKQYSVDQLKTAEYFPLHPTVASMLQLFGKLFGFVFVDLTGEEERARISPTGKASDLTWHEDVILYSVWNVEDEGGDFVGYLYLDLHPRPGKYGHAQCAGLQLGFQRRDGTRHYPSTALLANFTKPTKDKPSLLKHGEMLMLFHELGHGMHDLAGRCKYSRFHGAETVGDFNEAPSQMLENWCWDPAGLKFLSSHFETGEAMPDDMISALIRTKHVSASFSVLNQLRFCLFDMKVHSTRVPDEGTDFSKLYNELYGTTVGLKGLSESETGHGYAIWRHLFEGYDAGLYGYFWSNVNAMDMFNSAFKRDPMDEREGRRYRHLVLEKGGSQDEMLTLEQFLGRPPRSDAFFNDLGLD